MKGKERRNDYINLVIKYDYNKNKHSVYVHAIYAYYASQWKGCYWYKKCVVCQPIYIYICTQADCLRVFCVSSLLKNYLFVEYHVNTWIISIKMPQKMIKANARKKYNKTWTQ